MAGPLPRTHVRGGVMILQERGRDGCVAGVPFALFVLCVGGRVGRGGACPSGLAPPGPPSDRALCGPTRKTSPPRAGGRTCVQDPDMVGATPGSIYPRWPAQLFAAVAGWRGWAAVPRAPFSAGAPQREGPGECINSKSCKVAGARTPRLRARLVARPVHSSACSIVRATIQPPKGWRGLGVASLTLRLWRP